MVGITDVATHAGVAVSTVSYVLSGKRPISAPTRRRVLDSVAALGYRPPAAARSRTIGLAVRVDDGTHRPLLAEFLLSASVAARRHDCNLLLLTDHEEHGVLDAALLDQLLAGPARAHPGPGKHLLEPLAFLLAERLGQLDLRLAVAGPVALLYLSVQLARASGRLGTAAARAASLAAGRGLRSALGPATGRGAPATAGGGLARTRTVGGTTDVVAALLGAGAARALLLVVARVARTPVVPAAAASAVPAAASHQSSVLSSASGSGASGANDGTPSWDSPSTASASGRKGASSGSSSRPRRPIRSRK